MKPRDIEAIIWGCFVCGFLLIVTGILSWLAILPWEGR